MYRGTEAGLPYLVAAPASRRAKDRLRPVLCFLHGYEEGAPSELRTGLTRHGPLRALNPARVEQDPERPVWLSFGEVARYVKADFIRTLRLEPYAPGATGDRVYLDEGADHVGSATRAYADSRIYSWLLSRRLD